MKKTAALIAAFALILCGCSEKNEQVNYPDSDAAWNELNIMETENGYYIGGTSSLFLQYHDKNTGNEIMLCDKPECPHDGRETCTATYKNLNCSNVVLYDNELYFAAIDSDGETLTVSLYKAACDGSSLDKVSELYSVKNSTDKYHVFFDKAFLTVHRGYAFINVDIYNAENIGLFAGFIGGGFYRTDLRNGESKALVQYDDFWNDKKANSGIYPCEDYILYENFSSNTRKYYRIKLNADSPEQIHFENEDRISVEGADSSKIYVLEFPEGEYNKIVDEYNMVEYDAETLAKIRDYKVCGCDVTVYDNRLYVSRYQEHEDNLIVVYEDGKEKFRTNKLPGDSEVYNSVSFSSGKIYIGKRASSGFGTHIYYSCDIEDFLSENINWKTEYSNENAEEKWSEHCSKRASNEEIYNSYSNF